MERQRILEREQRWARPAAIAAILSAPLYIGAMFIDQGGEPPTLTALLRIGLQTERFRAIDSSDAELLLGAALRTVAFLLLAGALLYLFKAVEARGDRVRGAMVGFAFIGPVLLAVQGLLSTVTQISVASDFVAQASPGGDVFTLLEGLIDDSTGLEIASSLGFPAILGMVVAMVYFSLQAMRAGLLTRFLGTLGMAFGVGFVFIAPSLTLLMTVLWFMWLGLVFLDRTPGPRPPAWEVGVAIPWPRPGDEQPEPPAEALPEGVVEGEGAELGANGSGDRSARRERARKRKRKRRR